MPAKTTHRKRNKKTLAAAEIADAPKPGAWTYAFEGTNGSNLALVRSGVNDRVMRIIDVQTGALRNEHTELTQAITSVSWGTQDGRSVVAMGLKSGTILIYSPARMAVVRTLEMAHGDAVTSVAFSGPHLFSLDRLGKVVQWDGAKIVSTLQTTVSQAQKLLVTADGKRVVVANLGIEMWDVASQKKLTVWPGHTSPMVSMLWALDETMLVTAAVDDRYVHVWDAAVATAASEGDAMAPTAVLALDTDVRDIDVSPDGSILAIGSDGSVASWYKAAVPLQKKQGQSSNARARSAMGYAPDGRLRIVSPESPETAQPVHLARFSRVAGDGDKVLLVRGNTLHPVFETVSLADDQGHFGQITLQREAQDGMLALNENKKADTAVIYSEAAANVTNTEREALRSSQRAVEETEGAALSLADRIRMLTVDSAGAGAGADSKGNSKQVSLASMTAGSLVRVLVQALHTSDQQMLDAVLNNYNRTNVVYDTIIGTPPAYILPLVQQLFSRLGAKSNRAIQILVWLRACLTLHSSHLMTIPSLVTQLSGFYQSLEARLESHQRLQRLESRLELVMTQVRARHRYENEKNHAKIDAQQQSENRSVTVYREEDDTGSMEGSHGMQTPVWQAEESTDDEGEGEDDVAGKDDDLQLTDSEEEEE
ncbi:Small subunit (SSU) processome component, partial [Coemansia sp. Benny D115]